MIKVLLKPMSSWLTWCSYSHQMELHRLSFRYWSDVYQILKVWLIHCPVRIKQSDQNFANVKKMKWLYSRSHNMKLKKGNEDFIALYQIAVNNETCVSLCKNLKWELPLLCFWDVANATESLTSRTRSWIHFWFSYIWFFFIRLAYLYQEIAQ